MVMYETILILKPVLSDPEAAEYSEKVKSLIVGDGGEIITHEVWGRRKLTHMIGKAREGVYTFLRYQGTPAVLKKLHHSFGVSDKVLRHMTVVGQDPRKSEPQPRAPRAAAPREVRATK